ncbi:MAG TPA: DoxX family protein [Candidatus Saccharimonadales bacterium]|nr:DoxX family protein [Candidatus Saccharimonadales bacterium]
MKKALQPIVSQIPEPAFSRFIFADTRLSFIWLILRLYVGWEWVQAGYEKVTNPVWTGSQAGIALHGFLLGSLRKSSGEHPDVSGWYAAFIHGVALPQAAMFSYMVSYGELLVGIALILGIFTGIAAFFGAFMNMNYLFAGTVSINPLLFLLELFIILAWRVGGWYGIDRWLLPMLGTPWQPGKMFKNKK